MYLSLQLCIAFKLGMPQNAVCFSDPSCVPCPVECFWMCRLSIFWKVPLHASELRQ